MPTSNARINALYLGRILKNVLLHDSVAYLILFLTDRCNARCKMCFSHEGMAEKSTTSRHEILSLEDIERLLSHKRLANLVQLTLSGGEPFLRDDIGDIIRLYAKLHPYSRITVPTNGLLTGRISDILGRAVGMHPELNFSVPLTLLGVGEAHDNISGVKGHFTKLEETIKSLQALRKHPNFKLYGVTVLSSFNQDGVQEVVDYFRGHRAEFDDFNILYTRGDPRDPASSDIQVSAYRRYREQLGNKGLLNFLERNLWRLVDHEIEHREMDIKCNAGRKLLVVGERGDVYPCELMYNFTDPLFGNLYDYGFDLDSILDSKRASEIKNIVKEGGCHCTFECAIFSSIIFSPENFGSYIKTALKG